MKLQLPLLLLSSGLSIATGACYADEKSKGHGAGGVRAEHASEKGLEKGKAWAGSKEKEEKEEREEKVKGKNVKEKKVKEKKAK